MKYLFLAAMVLPWALFSCKPTQGTDLSNNDIVGAWQTQEVEVTLRSINNSRKDSSFTIDQMAMEQSTGTRPATTFIQADGSYRDEVRNTEGKLIKENKGYWHLNSDSLYIRMASQTQGEMRFGIEQKGNKMQLTNRIDWDVDGQKDDEMVVKLRRE